ncbi:hypothetical protein B0H10DRAFT_1947637 [Mycena sp. CBHHK59/15]|nr:hypothetical protein B0H10DRAFT_1947637 [Mycena sp. CBHHK59/15]
MLVPGALPSSVAQTTAKKCARRIGKKLMAVHHDHVQHSIPFLYLDWRVNNVESSGFLGSSRCSGAGEQDVWCGVAGARRVLFGSISRKHEAIRDLADNSDDENSPAAPTTGGGRHNLRGPGGRFVAANSPTTSTTTAAAPSPSAFTAPAPITPTVQYPAPPQPPPRAQVPYIEDDDMAEEKMFYGDWRAGESPHDFKKKVMQKFMGKGMSNAEKVEALGLGMASGSPADAWFDDPARNTMDKTSWATMSAEKLNVEDIGKRVKHGGVEEFGHVIWIRNMVRIAGDIPDPGGLFIGVVREKMPMIMQDLLGLGTVFASWAALETAVVDIKRAAIINAQAKEARLVEMAAAVKPTSRHTLTSQIPTQIHPQRYALQPYPPSVPAFPTPSGTPQCLRRCPASTDPTRSTASLSTRFGTFS